MVPMVAATLADGVGVFAVAAAVIAVAVTTVSARGASERRRVAARLGVLLAPSAGASSASDVVGRLGRLEAQIAADRRAGAESAAMLGRLTEALSALPEGVVVCDERGAVCFRNHEAQSFSGARHGEALAELAVGELLVAALAGGPAERNIDLYGPPRRAMLIQAVPLSAGDRRLGAVAIITDVSERRRLDAVRRDFVANVSHELKSPVGALGILAETILGEDEAVVVRRLAERMQVEAFRVARIIDDLLDLTRIESEDAPERELVAVEIVVTEAVERIRALAGHQGITIATGEIPPTLGIVGDRRQLVSAMHNLLENAVKYSGRGSAVEVAVACAPAADGGQGSWVEIDVRDHGIGIPARDLERIFERFYRVDRARARDTGGTGLGLSIVGHVAANHGGQVHVDSREGAGSTFTLRLPADPRPADPRAAELPRGDAASVGAGRGRRD